MSIRDEMFELAKNVNKKRASLYHANKEQVDELNKLQDLKEKVDTVMLQYGLSKNINNDFKNIEEHFNYLLKKGLCGMRKSCDSFIIIDKINDKTTKTIHQLKGDYLLYHGTNIMSAKKIIETNKFKANKEDINSIKYNKIFFTPNLDYAKICGIAGGYMDSTDIHFLDDKYIIFKCNTKKCDMYTYIAGEEYFIWDDADTNIIEHIYLCEDRDILKEITKEELLEM